MFGEPCSPPPNSVILPFVWTWLFKANPVTGEHEPKSRATADGSPRGYARTSSKSTLAETYAACVDHTAHRLLWALAAALNLICIGVDVGNAFAEAEAPLEASYMIPDKEFRDWWENNLGREPIPPNYVIPILKALQGHKYAPRCWDKHISGIITKDLEFKACTHEPCLYYKHTETGIILILRVTDDFSIAAQNKQIADNVANQIQTHMSNPLNELGYISKFNGLNIHQTNTYNHLSCETYINKIISHHGWTLEEIPDRPTPMKSYTAYQTEIQIQQGSQDPAVAQKLERKMKLNYRQGIGELIFALTICRIDISPALISLSQHSHLPDEIHYEALKHLFLYLKATKY